jgi:hypothetical protein
MKLLFALARQKGFNDKESLRVFVLDVLPKGHDPSFTTIKAIEFQTLIDALNGLEDAQPDPPPASSTIADAIDNGALNGAM